MDSCAALFEIDLQELQECEISDLKAVQVPDGQGAYRQVVRYCHVGPGQGDFEPVPETRGTGIMDMLPVVATVAILFLVLLLAVTLSHISANFCLIPWPSQA